MKRIQKIKMLSAVLLVTVALAGCATVSPADKEVFAALSQNAYDYAYKAQTRDNIPDNVKEFLKSNAENWSNIYHWSIQEKPQDMNWELEDNGSE